MVFFKKGKNINGKGAQVWERSTFSASKFLLGANLSSANSFATKIKSHFCPSLYDVGVISKYGRCRPVRSKPEFVQSYKPHLIWVWCIG